jgi:CRISPR-associated protein Csx3
MQPFPAVVVGGPPNSGKSVLTYHLSQWLRQQGIDHYVLRACPDGEGDWYQEAPAEQVRVLRNKGDFSPAFVAAVCRDLARRHLPLLVDAGGRPRPEQEIIFDQCTHALLIAASDEGLAEWRQLAERHGLTILAEVRSTLVEPDLVDASAPILRGQIHGLVRQQMVAGPMLQALVEQLARLFAYTPDELREAHLEGAPVELVIEIDRLGRTLGLVHAQEVKWEPADLPPLLDYLPSGEALAIYGRGPNWLYLALALHAAPQPFYQFDARLGWVQPARVQIAAVASSGPLHYEQTMLPDGYLLTIRTVQQNKYLDYNEVASIAVPPVARDLGLVLSGPLPHWLMAGIALVYQQRPWLAIFQPPLGAAVVVCSHDAAHPVGSLISL